MTRASTHIPSEQLEGVVVVGMDDHAAFHSITQRFPTHPFGYTPPVYVVEPDLERAREAITQLGIGTDKRYSGAFGPNAGRELVQGLGAQLHEISIPTQVVACGTHDPHLITWLEQELRGLKEIQSIRLRAWRHEIIDRSACRGDEYWASRFREIDSGEGARIMIVTTRYSSYMQHASRDLALSFEQLGHAVSLVHEPNDHTMLSPQRTVHAQLEFDPDIVISTNYPRPMRDAYFPPGAVNVCWIQDAMAHLFDPLPSSVSEHDFISGFLYAGAPSIEAYPESRRMPFPIPVSEHTFHPAPVESGEQQRMSCDIAYISHQSQPVDALYKDQLEYWPARYHPVLNEIRGSIEEWSVRWSDSIVNLNPCSFSRQFHHLLQPGDDPQLLMKLWHQFAHPMLERALRHQTLEWAAAIARKHGLEMRLYGRGWEHHPTLAQYACGEIDHDDSLRACYQCAKVQLHSSALGVGHQRQYECAMSGGLMLSLRSWSEFLRENWIRVSEYVSSEAEPDAMLVKERTPCYSLRNHPELATLLHDRDRFPVPPRGWDHARYQDVFARSPDDPDFPDWEGNGAHSTDRPLNLLSDPYAMTFSTQEELESRVLMACRDAEWRDNCSSGTRKLAVEQVSMGRFAAQLISKLSSHYLAVPKQTSEMLA